MLKRAGVRLVAEGGKLVKAEMEGIGDEGEKAFGRIEARSQAMSLAVKAALVAVASAAVATFGAMVRDGLLVIDSQAKLAASLRTTVESMQIMERAGERAGVSMSQIETASLMLTRQLSQAVQGTGSAAKALDRLGLSAEELLVLPIDKRMIVIQDAISGLVPAAEQAAVASELFGARSGLVFSRLNSDTIRQATQDVHDFGVVVSEVDAAQIQRTNDAVSRLGLIWRGVSNQMAVAVAPAIEQVAEALAAMARVTGPLGQAIQLFFGNLQRLGTYAATFLTLIGTRWVLAFIASRAATNLLTGALTLLRGAILRTGLGALIVGAGELVYWFSRLVQGAGGFGNAMNLLGDLAKAVWSEIGDAGKALVAVLEGAAWAIARGFVDAFKWIFEQWDNLLNTMYGPFNALMETIGSDFRLRAVNPIGGMLGSASDWLGEQAGAAMRRAEDIYAGMDRTREAVAALVEALNAAGGDIDGALRNVEGTVDDVTDALNRAGAAGKAAGKDIAEGGEVALTGWDAVVGKLADYAKSAQDIGEGIGDAVVKAFKGAEDAVAEFVKKGKLDFSSLVTSFIADLGRLATRRFILGPIANALSGVMAEFNIPFLSTPSFDGGGHTGHAPRVGGLDGKGGFLAMMHPQERVTDESRGAGRGGGREGGDTHVHFHGVRDFESFRRSRTQIGADIQRAVAMGSRGR